MVILLVKFGDNYYDWSYIAVNEIPFLAWLHCPECGHPLAEWKYTTLFVSWESVASEEEEKEFLS